MHGVQKLLETIALLADRVGHALDVRILSTLYDGRTRYARETLAEIRALFRRAVLRHGDPLEREAARGRAAWPAHRRHSRRARTGAQDYAALALEAHPRTRGANGGTARREFAAARGRDLVLRRQRASDVRIAGDFNGWVPDKDVRSLAARDRARTGLDQDAARCRPAPTTTATSSTASGARIPRTPSTRRRPWAGGTPFSKCVEPLFRGTWPQVRSRHLPRLSHRGPKRRAGEPPGAFSPAQSRAW